MNSKIIRYVGAISVAVLILGVGFRWNPADFGPEKTFASSTHKDANRSPSAAEDETRRLDDLILGMKTSGDVSSTIQKIMDQDQGKDSSVVGNKLIQDSQGSHYEIKNDVLRLYSIHAEMLQYAEGLVYRLRHVVEPTILSYAMSNWALRAFHQNEEQGPAYLKPLFAFLTDPNAAKSVLGQTGPFESANHLSAVTNLQVWVSRNLAPILETKVDELQQLIEAGSFDREILQVDTRLFFRADREAGIGSYLTEHEQRQIRRSILATHLKLEAAYLNYAIGVAYWASSFHMDGYVEFFNKLTEEAFLANATRHLTILTGDTSPLNTLPSAIERRNAVRFARALHPNFLKIREEAVKEGYLEKAKARFQKGAEQELAFYQELQTMADKGVANPEWLLINPQEVKNYLFIIVKQAQQRLDAFKGPINLVNSLTGESHPVNVLALFSNDKMKDLMAYFPTGFNRGKEINGRGADTYRWNYDYGRAEVFPDPSFGGLLPGATNPSFDKEGSELDPNNVKSRMFHINTQLAIPLVAVFLDSYL